MHGGLSRQGFPKVEINLQTIVFCGNHAVVAVDYANLYLKRILWLIAFRIPNPVAVIIYMKHSSCTSTGVTQIKGGTGI